jgi:hypothetical protein
VVSDVREALPLLIQRFMVPDYAEVDSPTEVEPHTHSRQNSGTKLLESSSTGDEHSRSVLNSPKASNGGEDSAITPRNFSF